MEIENYIFSLNPYFRMRSDDDMVVLYGANDRGSWRLHPAFGIVLALCNGKRTIRDIAQITRPFVAVDDEVDAYKIAVNQIFCFLRWMSYSKQEQSESLPEQPRFPIQSPVVLKEIFNDVFSGNKPLTVDYDPYLFVPHNEYYRTKTDKTSHESVPFLINWHLTSICSAECRYCYLKRRNVNPLGIERIVTLIEEAARYGVFFIDLSGGDILLYPYLIDIIALLHKYKFLPLLLSTKSFLTRETAKHLARYSEVLHEIQFSIDTDDNAVAEYLGTVAK
jgi:sulfatase maturation enzyme AslB (radical SAM superfamily)